MTVDRAWIRFRREHHGHVHVAGEMAQPFGMAGIRKSCEMESVLLSRRGDDGVHPAIEGQFDGGFYCVSGNPSGAKGSTAIRRGVAGAKPPTADGDLVGGLE